jgi:peptidoglycan/xylan/chitin deacetylase (PgdA/CDA1 family)
VPRVLTAAERPCALPRTAVRKISATFCVIGQNISAPGGAEILKRIVAEGHTLCNHATTYADMREWTHAQIEADLKANLKIIRDALGDSQQEVPYWRARTAAGA